MVDANDNRMAERNYTMPIGEGKQQTKTLQRTRQKMNNKRDKYLI